MQFIAPKSAPLLELLTQWFPDSSKRTLRNWIMGKRILVNNQPAKHALDLVPEQAVIDFLPKKTLLQSNVDVIYEDRYLIVIDKPEGLLSVDTPYETTLSIHEVLKEKFSKGVFPVHRLDKETSGVMVFALSREVKEKFKVLFRDHDIIREYIAIVEGNIPFDKGTWSHFLKETTSFKMQTVAEDEGEMAISHFETIKRLDQFSVLKITLETGKKNQIRVQAQKEGFPIIGDKKYEAKTNPIKRLGLHAQTLGFVHPITKKQMIFHSPLPSSFTRFFHR